jgi:hypothetical protein
MVTVFSVLIILQFVVVVSHDMIDIPGWVYGSRAQAAVGRSKFLVGTLSTAIFPCLAVGRSNFWSRPKPAFVYSYWAYYCAITMIFAVAMWYIPYLFGAKEDQKRQYLQMYEGTRHVLPARGNNPHPNLFTSSCTYSSQPPWPSP